MQEFLSPAAPLLRLRGAIEKGCRAMPPLGDGARTMRLAALVEAQAWSEAALALLQLEAPGWKLRRLDLDMGEWSCVLTRHPAMPIAFDETAEGRDALLPLAILAAIKEARRLCSASDAPTLKPARRPFGEAVLCEDFR